MVRVRAARRGRDFERWLTFPLSSGERAGVRGKAPNERQVTDSFLELVSLPRRRGEGLRSASSEGLESSEGSEDSASPQVTEERAEVPDALHRVGELGLIERVGAGDVRVHPLLCRFAQTQLAKQLDAAQTFVEEWVEDRAGTQVSAGLPAPLRAWLPHLRHVAEQAASRNSPHASTLLTWLGRHLKDTADYAAARTVYEWALKIDEASFGPDHPEIARDVNNLGLLLQALGELPAARAHLDRALKINEASFGPDHPNVARDVNNLGLLLQDLGELPAARAYLERALKIDEASFGPDHPKVATDVNNLGLLLQALGELPAARAHLERALRIAERVYGAEHPTTKLYQRNLASLNAPAAPAQLVSGWQRLWRWLGHLHG